MVFSIDSDFIVLQTVPSQGKLLPNCIGTILDAVLQKTVQVLIRADEDFVVQDCWRGSGLARVRGELMFRQDLEVPR